MRRRAGRCPATRTPAASSATTCCRPRSARCARRRSCPRRWPAATSGQLERVVHRRHPGAARLSPEPVRRQPAAGRDRGARGAASSSKLERADMNALGLARHFDDRRWRAPVLRRAVARRCAPTSTSGCRRCSACAIPTASGATSSTGSAGACSRSRRCRRRYPACACYEILRSALRAAGGRLVLGRRGRRGRPRRRPGHGGVDARRRAATVYLRAPLVRAGHRRLHLGRRSSSTRTGSRTSGCSACRCAACPRRASRASCAVLRRAADRPRRRRGRLRPARRGDRQRARRRRRAAAARSRGARARARGSRWRAAIAPRRSVVATVEGARRRRHDRPSFCTSCCAARSTTASSARSARPRARSRT